MRRPQRPTDEEIATLPLEQQLALAQTPLDRIRVIDAQMRKDRGSGAHLVMQFLDSTAPNGGEAREFRLALVARLELLDPTEQTRRTLVGIAERRDLPQRERVCALEILSKRELAVEDLERLERVEVVETDPAIRSVVQKLLPRKK